MCGIVGYIGTKPFNTDTIKILMLINGYERGMDSTGIYCKEKGVVKDALDVHDYIVKYPIEPTNLFIGHTRNKTVGLVNKNTAHPFKYDNIVLVHNGTLQNHYQIFNKLNIKTIDWEVDSEAIVAKLAHDQNPMVFSELKGAAAVIFTDINDSETMYVFRNHERPLHYVTLTNGLDKWMYMSSESESLEVAGFKTKDIIEFEENMLYTITKGEIVAKKEIKSFPLVQSNTPVVSNTNKVTYSTDFTKKYLKCDRHFQKSENNILHTLEIGKYYYVIKDSGHTDLLVLVKGIEVTLPRFVFSWSSNDIKTVTIGEIGKLNTDLVINKDTKQEKTCGVENDLLEIISINPENSKYAFQVKNLANDDTFSVQRDWIDFKFIKELVL